ncbi:MAG: hypothetical protein JSS95_02570 [Acidobacteria bacterium]|nr:hypothetical protein [Acidobacteriota bacterium]
MKPSITTLFSEEPPRHTAPSALAVSFVVHVMGFFLLFLGLRHVPQMNDRLEQERYTVRLLKAPRPEMPKKQIETREAYTSPSSAGAPRFEAATSAESASGSASDRLPAGAPSAPASSQPQLAQLPVRSQTLIQPDAPPDVQLLQPIPIPVAVIWSPVNLPTKTIVAPPPQEITVADLRPAVIKPNREPKLADVNISSTRFPSSVPVIAGSTSPVVVRGPEAPKQVPTTSSAEIAEPTPARVISLSSLRATGDVVIPLANQSAQGGTSQMLAPTRPDASAGSGSGGAAKLGSGKTGDQGVGAGAGAKGQAGNDGGDTAGAGSGQGGQWGTGSRTDRAGGTGQGLGSGYEGSVTHLTMPKDGQFGVVVVGSSVTDEYPEVVDVWHGRLVYTVYLHVGTGKNWIMQYTVPASEEAATGGTVIKPEAPWPYDILRPHLPENDYTADALIVHGFVNLAGRFERLGLVFPQGFTQAKFLLDSLMQWKFRPARQGTKLSMVEVLLIIPAEQ